MSTNQSKKRKSLSNLKELVEKLTDRDLQLKKDARLFEKFFENFPVPVSLWSANKEGKILSKKDKGFFCADAKEVKDLVSCPDTSREICKHQKAALSGLHTRELIQKDEKCFYVVVVPLRDDKEDVIGTSGIAWDVSSNNFILNTLIDIKSSTEGKTGILKDINEKAERAIQNSRLKLLQENLDREDKSEQ